MSHYPGLWTINVETDAAGAFTADSEPLAINGLIYSIQVEVPASDPLAAAATFYMRGKNTLMPIFGTAAVPVGSFGVDALYYPRHIAHSGVALNGEATEYPLVTGEPVEIVIAAGDAAKLATIYVRYLNYLKSFRS